MEGIEPTSLDYQSSALAVELHREVVDPTGLKPAPHGLKVRCSVTRAPGQDIADFRFQIADWSLNQRFFCAKRIGNWQSTIGNDLAVAEGFEPSIAGLTIRCLSNLATPQKMFAGSGVEPADVWLMRPIKTVRPPLLCSHCSGCGDETRTRIISFTRRALCYPIELRRNLVDWEGFKPSQEVCRTSMLSLHHQPEIWWLWVELNHQPRAYETLALFPLELHSRL